MSASVVWGGNATGPAWTTLRRYLGRAGRVAARAPGRPRPARLPLPWPRPYHPGVSRCSRSVSGWRRGAFASCLRVALRGVRELSPGGVADRSDPVACRRFHGKRLATSATPGLPMPGSPRGPGRGNAWGAPAADRALERPAPEDVNAWPETTTAVVRWAP